MIKNYYNNNLCQHTPSSLSAIISKFNEGNIVRIFMCKHMFLNIRDG